MITIPSCRGAQEDEHHQIQSKELKTELLRWAIGGCSGEGRGRIAEGKGGY